MHQRSTSIVFFIGGFLCLVATYFLPKVYADLPSAKQQVRTYVETGQYTRDLESAYTQGLEHLTSHADLKKKAIVFDIDETLLSNYDHMVSNSFGGNDQWYKKEEMLAESTPIVPMVRLYHQAQKLGYQVFLITGRPQDEAAATMKNLRKVGLHHWAKIAYWPSQSKQTVEAFKASERHAIEAKGYTIVLNVSDQKSDLKGGASLFTLKLPNPFYRIPGNHHRHLPKAPQ